MSNALAVAGVTAVLKDLLDDGLIDHAVTDTLGQGVTVSALAPDEIQLGSDQQPRLNFFLYQATPNAAWRNMGFPALDASGRRTNNPPLALDLHYMITAYGALDLQAEVLLGYAMLLLHETPVLARAAIRKSLDPPPSAAVTGSLLPTVYQSLLAANLARSAGTDQNNAGGDERGGTIEALDRDPGGALPAHSDLPRHRRPDPANPGHRRTAACPVARARDPTTHLETGPTVIASMQSPSPVLSSIVYANGQNWAETWQPDRAERTEPGWLRPNPAARQSAARHRGLSDRADERQPGQSRLSLCRRTRPCTPPAHIRRPCNCRVGSDPAALVSNPQPLSIAPKITALPAAVTIDGSGNLTLTPTCTPQLQPNQVASLILGDIQTQAAPITTATPTPSFTFSALPPGAYWVRLRVDNVDSHLINFGPPPAFAGPQIVVTR